MCGSSHLVEVFNDECRSQDVGPRPPKPRGFSHPSSDNEFIIPRNNYVSDTQRTDTDDLSEKIRSNSSILLLYIKNITYLDRDLASSKTPHNKERHNHHHHT